MITDFVSRLPVHPTSRLSSVLTTDARSLTTESILGIHVASKAAQLPRAATRSFSRRDALNKFYGQAERAISIRKLKSLLTLHFEPIKLVVFQCPSSPFRVGRSHLVECFTLICIQRLSQPNLATQPCHWHDNWNTRGSSIPVLSY